MAMVNAARELNMSVVWSGRRLTVIESVRESARIGKVDAHERQLYVVGKFEYLTR